MQLKDTFGKLVYKVEDNGEGKIEIGQRPMKNEEYKRIKTLFFLNFRYVFTSVFVYFLVINLIICLISLDESLVRNFIVRFVHFILITQILK